MAARDQGTASEPTSYAVQFAEARSMLQHVVEVGGEVDGAMVLAFAAWLRANPFDTDAALAALREQSEVADGG